MGKTYRRNKTYDRVSRRVDTHRDLPDIQDDLISYEDKDNLTSEEDYYGSKLRSKKQPDKPEED